MASGSVHPLVSAAPSRLDCAMSTLAWIGAAAGATIFLLAVRRLARRRRAAKLADQALADAIKAKDAFRR